MNSTARVSSSSGWLGGWPAAPKLSGVGTSPRPKRCSQTRLTITRAVSGFAGEASQLGQLATAAPAGDRCGRFVAEHADEPAGDDLAGLVELAADVERAVDGSIAFADAHREGARRAAGPVDEPGGSGASRACEFARPEPVAVRSRPGAWRRASRTSAASCSSIAARCSGESAGHGRGHVRAGGKLDQGRRVEVRDHARQRARSRSACSGRCPESA